MKMAVDEIILSVKWLSAKHNVCEDIGILSAEFNFFVCIQISNKHKHKTMLKQMAARFINHAIIPIRRTTVYCNDYKFCF